MKLSPSLILWKLMCLVVAINLCSYVQKPTSNKKKRQLLIIWFFVLLLASIGCQRKEVSFGKQDLTYAVAGKEIQVTAWEPEFPADIILVIDQSDSMSKGRNPTDQTGVRVKGSLSFLEFIAGRSRTDRPNRFGVVNFGTDAPREYAVQLTQVTSVDDPAIKQIGTQLIPLELGYTSFISAFRLAMQLLREGGSFEKQVNRAIVVFTDGQPDDRRRWELPNYFEELEEFLAQEAKPNRVDIFVIGIDADGKQWSETLPSWRRLVGDNRVFTTPNMQALKEQYNRIVQQIWHLPEVEPVVVSSQSSVEFEVEPYLAAIEFHLFPSRQGLSLAIYRPDGKVIKPGQDSDAPSIKHLSTFDRILVQEPEPGRWRYEVVGGAGTVEVLRNPIPLRMHLISPLPTHPQGKPMRLIAEFKRTDGKPVKPHPDYPLGLAADVVTPAEKRLQVKFPLERGQDGGYIGEPEISDTMTIGEYRVTLKVTGGGKYQNKYPVTVQVSPVPYLIVQQPTESMRLAPASTVKVRAKLLQAGKPLRPQDAFTNHTDYLVIAQMIQTPDGRRGQAVWLRYGKQENSIADFEGVVPMPKSKKGLCSLAVKLAPEEKTKQTFADQTVVEFLMRRPWWVSVLIWTLIALPILAIIVWFLHRRSQERLKFSFHYWVEDQATSRVFAFTRINQSTDLPEVPLKVTRIGKEKEVKLEPATSTRGRKSAHHIIDVSLKMGYNDIHLYSHGGRDNALMACSSPRTAGDLLRHKAPCLCRSTQKV